MNADFIGEATLILEEAYSDIGFTIEFRPHSDNISKKFTLECFSKDRPQMRLLHEKLFWLVPEIFKLEKDWLYCLRVTTYKDIGLSIEKAVFTVIMEVKTEMIPDITKSITDQEWELFNSRLTYMINDEINELKKP